LLRRRPPLALALVGLVVLLTGLTGGRQERAKGLAEPITVYRLLEVKAVFEAAG